MSRWYLLTRMGATSLMYDALRGEVAFNINFMGWPKYREEQTYAEVAHRVIRENKIGPGDIVGGSSLGV